MENMINKDIEAFVNSVVRKDNVFPALKNPSKFPPFIISIDNCLSQIHSKKLLMIPNLKHSNTVSIFSDYGGEHQESPYYTYSFLIAETGSHQLFLDEIQKIRLKYSLNAKEIEFKQLRYGPLNRALPDILNAADWLINSLLFTLVVDKKIISFFGPNEFQTLKDNLNIMASVDLNHWKPQPTEKLLRIVHIISYLIKITAYENQMFFWLTDDDAIVSNKKQLSSAMALLQSLMRDYLNTENPPKLHYSTPFNNEKESNINFNSFLAFPDLIAGTLADYFIHTKDKSNGKVSNEHVDKILSWLCHQGVMMKKQNIIFTLDTNTGNILYEDLNFQLNNQPENIIKYYINL